METHVYDSAFLNDIWNRNSVAFSNVPQREAQEKAGRIEREGIFVLSIEEIKNVNNGKI